MPAFFDTNILIYALSEGEKGRNAGDLARQGGWISVQVLNEMVRVMRAKLRYDWPVIGEALAEYQAMLGVQAMTIETHRVGLVMAERHGFAVFDSMIVASALLAGCDTLYSEDMHHGLVIEGRLTIINPFKGT